ncbi:MAG: hypothetical protein FGM62_01680 [Methylobacterium sp.]|nr:hypothetical protein [Methylobacterium sp.]
MKNVNPEYLAQALALSVEEQERVLSRMTGKLPRRLEKDKLNREEALAIQLELEDEQLQEWRERMHAIKAESKAKEKSDKTRKAGEKKAGDKS